MVVVWLDAEGGGEGANKTCNNDAAVLKTQKALYHRPGSSSGFGTCMASSFVLFTISISILLSDVITEMETVDHELQNPVGLWKISHLLYHLLKCAK